MSSAHPTNELVGGALPPTRRASAPPSPPSLPIPPSPRPPAQSSAESGDIGGGSAGGSRAAAGRARGGRGRQPRSHRSPVEATASALASAIGGGAPSTPRRPRPPPSAFECCLALELIAAGKEWQWTVSTLIGEKLAPWLSEGGGRSALLRLLGRLGSLTPSAKDAGALGLRAQLVHLLRQPHFGPAEKASAVSSLLEMLRAAGGRAYEEREALQLIDRWHRDEPASWGTIPLPLRDWYHDATASGDEIL